MANEQEVKQELITKFSIPEDKIVVQRARRIFAEIPIGRFREIMEYVIYTMKFDSLGTITGTDDGPNFGATYHMAHQDGTVLSLRIFTPRENPIIKTITDIYPAATMYERELVDLLGIKVEGLPKGERYPLPDDWPADEHPLRKDWKKQPTTSGQAEEKKNG